MKKLLLLIGLGLMLLPGLALAKTYDVDKTEYAGTAVKGVPATVQLKTPDGSSKYVLPSDVVGNFYQAYIHIGRTLNATNYLTVTFGDGASIVYNTNEWSGQGMTTIPETDFDKHPSRGITVKFTHSGDYDENLYLTGYWVQGTQTGSTPAPGTPPPTNTPGPTVKPTPAPTPKGTTSPNPTAGATAGATSQPTTPPGSGDPDPGGGETECTAACQALIDQLDCPSWDEYMGAWSDMIRGTYPPPPDWEYVAAVMRDTIVPSMGQELVNRSPEIARIIADEFQSREKAVSPPSAVPDFTPPVPRLQDVPKVTGSINEDVPSFTPDYSEDKPFVIPDPSTLDFSDNSDDGYEYKPMVTENPDYVSSGPEPSEADKGYEVKPQPTFLPPKYVGGSWRGDEPPPDYQTNEGQTETIPEYQQRGEDTGSYQVYRDIPDVFQEYKGE